MVLFDFLRWVPLTITPENEWHDALEYAKTIIP